MNKKIENEKDIWWVYKAFSLDLNLKFWKFKKFKNLKILKYENFEILKFKDFLGLKNLKFLKI